MAFFHLFSLIQQQRPGYGHCTTSKVWQRKDTGAYELNIAAEVLNFPIEETLDTMIHEMCHLYCQENGIKEVPRGGKYHNGKFKAVAEAHGLTCIPQGQYGWNTTPGDNLVEYALNKGWNEIDLGRNTLPPAMRTGSVGTAQTNGAGRENGGRRTSSTRKLVSEVWAVCPGYQGGQHSMRGLSGTDGNGIKIERAHSKTKIECARSEVINLF